MTQKNVYSCLGVFLVGSWLFAALSLFVSTRVVVDWFSRSGAVMCLVAAAANFALVKVHQNDLANIAHDDKHTAREKAKAILHPPRTYVQLSRLGYVTGIVGTGIWGYGDLLL